MFHLFQFQGIESESLVCQMQLSPKKATSCVVAVLDYDQTIYWYFVSE